MRTSKGGQTQQRRRTSLIITTGDISDVDGFYALAEYAKTGADCMFIMNYPAYMDPNINKLHKDHISSIPEKMKTLKNGTTAGTIAEFGCGFDYGIDDYINEKNLCTHLIKLGLVDNKKPPVFNSIENPSLSNYCKSIQNPQDYFNEFTRVALFMCKQVWDEVKKENKGNLYFYVGGFNLVNPFSSDSLKTELLVYYSVVQNNVAYNGMKTKTFDMSPGTCLKICTQAGNTTFNSTKDLFPSIKLSDILQNRDIYFDMNGSAAFWNMKTGPFTIDINWESILNIATNDNNCGIKGFHIMGGVLAGVTPWTLGPFSFLRRLKSATMNQLYHPPNTHAMLQYFKKISCPIFVVPNHSVLQSEGNIYDSINNDESFLTEIAKAYYTSGYNPPNKPFDYLVAKSLCAQLTDNVNYPLDKSKLYFDKYFGVTVISAGENVSEWKISATEKSILELQPQQQQINPIDVIVVRLSGEVSYYPPLNDKQDYSSGVKKLKYNYKKTVLDFVGANNLYTPYLPNTTSSGGRKKSSARRPYEKRTVKELKERAKARKIKHYSKMTKAELIAAIRGAK